MFLTLSHPPVQIQLQKEDLHALEVGRRAGEMAVGGLSTCSTRRPGEATREPEKDHKGDTGSLLMTTGY
jgi:hypothetical protein